MDHPPRLRWGIGVLLGVGTLINYIDRVNLSVAGPTLEKVFVVPAVMGFIAGAGNVFSNAFITAGVVLLVGIVFYVFVLGGIEPIPEPGGGAPMPRPA